jgi:hypothetical protein
VMSVYIGGFYCDVSIQMEGFIVISVQRFFYCDECTQGCFIVMSVYKWRVLL